MMTKFLEFADSGNTSDAGDDDNEILDEAPPTELVTVEIQNITMAEAQELVGKYPDARIIAG